MKTRITLVVLIMTFLSGVSTFTQAQNEECMTKLSIFHEYVKAENFDAAYEPWMFVRTTCPKFNRAIIVDGEKILKHKIENSSGADKVTYINDLIKLLDESAKNFPSKYSKGEVMVDVILTKYKYKSELKLDDEKLYNGYDNVFNNAREDFKSPSGLYTYFSLMVDLFDAGKKPAQDLFNKYDDVMEKIDEEIQHASEKLNKYVAKEEAGETLSSKDKKYKRFYEQTLEAYDKIIGSVNSKLGERANCETLIPLYNKGFDENKTDGVWLRRAVSRMASKECTDDPLYIKLVKAYDETAPSADTKYYVAGLLLKEGKTNEALGYFREAFDLHTDAYKQGKLAEKIGQILKKKGRYAEARNYYREALKLNPANGRPHLAIAAMYASSANNCGDSNFNKRAVYWYAAAEAEKAGRVDPTLKSAAAQSAASYRAKAPSKSEIFNADMAGKQITIGCWIGGSVTVPKL